MADETLRSYSYRSETLAENVNLGNTDDVSRFISNIKGKIVTKKALLRLTANTQK